MRGHLGKKGVTFVLAVVLLFSIANATPVVSGAEKEAESLEHGWEARTEVPRIVNFVIIVVMLWFFLRKPIARYFASRREELQRLLEEAIQARNKAEAKLEEYRNKVRTLDEELAAMRADSDKEREGLRQRLMEEALKSAERIIEQAKVNIELERKRAIDSLRTEASMLALELAEELLKEKIAQEDKLRINKECIEGLR